ncbi:DnaD domain protein [Facklamia sp. 7083-14-GEN3]|uniref:DnaD domain protein n=1 Tax=Facklamia sp. 7083-14-GEN3 TaxID=2973478 RepID=UPI00215CBA19|nr:DnaD domain protein [Facklamia sp. 7083-14-GEN3]MCR8969450.1 DnaD domain protein [Facklamia sp. 7083-14-GEN3]
MVLQINPYQPYQVKLGLPLSFQQLQCLTQLYQPIIGTDAVGLYLTLAHQPREKLNWTYRMMHSRLLPILNMGIGDFNQARIHLEAVNLIRTYRDEKSHDDYTRQTIFYEMQMPLSVEHFFKHPQLSLALFNQIGDESYYGLIRLWKKEDLGQTELSEITLPFSEVISSKNENFHRSEVEEATEGVQFQDQYSTFELNEDTFQETFDLTFFYQILSSKQVSKEVLSQAVLTQVASLSQFYGLEEEAMAQVVKLAQSPVTQQIDLELLRTYAAKHQYFKKRQGHDQKDDQSIKQSHEEFANLKNDLRTNYPNFTDQEIEIILICQQMNPNEFLSQVKEEAGGFATSSEHYYLKELLEKSSLPEAVLNFLVYYLIVMEGHANFEKGRSNRLANEWQKEGLSTPAEALEFLHKQRLFKEKQNNIKNKKKVQSSKNTWSNNNKYQELVPSWLKEQQNIKSRSHENDSTRQLLINDKNPSSNQIDEDLKDIEVKPSSQLKEEEIRKRLENLLNKGED